MTEGEWIVCERGPRWATALRTLVERHTPARVSLQRIKEVRSLTDLNDRILANPASVALVEITRTNFGDILSWLANSNGSRRDLIVVALLDIETAADVRQLAIDALREAGASEAIESPRQLPSILALGERCFRRASVATACVANMSIAVRARAALPWQDA